MTFPVIKSKFRSKTLQSLWQKKEYRNFSVEVINYIVADTSACARNWCIQFSISGLANKDKSSIERYLKTLGYIGTENVQKKAAWLPHKTYINLPAALFDLLTKTINRKSSSNDSEYNPNEKYFSAKKFHVEHRYFMVLLPYSYFLTVAGIRGYHD
ncbi:MAG: hypothetical protein HRT87_09415 [Legionellales bacterium]|nr:hypothetical protein [Legionellales bacterium]